MPHDRSGVVAVGGVGRDRTPGMQAPDVGWLARGNHAGLGFFFWIDQGIGAAGLGAAADPQAQGEGGGPG